MSPHAPGEPPLAAGPPRSLVWRTEIQVLPQGRILERRERLPRRALAAEPPPPLGQLPALRRATRGGRRRALGGALRGRVRGHAGRLHRAFGWDRADGALGEARPEFEARGYELQQLVGLRARAGDVRAHPRENREVTIVALDPRPGAEPGLWEQVLDIWVASSELRPEEEPARRSFARGRLGELRALFSAGMGSWYVALDADRREVVGCCGIVDRAGRADAFSPSTRARTGAAVGSARGCWWRPAGTANATTRPSAS